MFTSQTQLQHIFFFYVISVLYFKKKKKSILLNQIIFIIHIWLFMYFLNIFIGCLFILRWEYMIINFKNLTM